MSTMAVRKGNTKAPTSFYDAAIAKPAAAPAAPLSWKDAVKRAPAQPQPKISPQKPSPSMKAKDSSKKKSHGSESRTPTKLAARSRSISRIVQSASYRKHDDLFPATSPNETIAAEVLKSVESTTPKKMVKQVSFGKEVAPVEKKTRTDSDSKRFADLVSRLGLNDTQIFSHSIVAKKSMESGGRPRSASADNVLLSRAAPPMWLLAGAPQTPSRCSTPKLNGRRSRKDRSMSVPNTAFGVSSVAEMEEKQAISPVDTNREVFEFTKPIRTNSDEDTSELDSEDTRSESTSDSSCPSPRHAPVSQFRVQQRESHRLEVSNRQSFDEIDDFSDYVTPEDEEDDYEAFLLLDRINSLSAEFKAHREYEESSALAWSVQHAARQGVISPQLQQNLLANIRNGSWEEARDVLYHKCHLVPAVGSATEASHATPDPVAEETFSKCVDELSPVDSNESRHQKLRVLKLLSDLLTKWVKIVGYERGLSEEHIALTSGSLFLAGSYRLGLNDPLSDIDAVCVVPWHVTHEDFFSSFCTLLEQTSGVTHLAPVPNAYVPLISLSFLGVSMDLLCARLPMTGVEPHQEIDSDHMLVGVDPTSMKSLNAPRVSSMLLCLVPKRRVFRIVLRAVRAWARRRGIYSSKLGYLGGISWAILVAFVCQMYPDAEPSKLFVRFFQVFSEWQWPRPVMLNMVYDAGLGFEMWDPRQNIYDRSHIMPIITPAYPHMNSSVQVSQSTFSVIYEEIWRARYLAEVAEGVSRSISLSVAANGVDVSSDPTSQLIPPKSALSVDTGANNSAQAAASNAFEWDKLFQRSNFFIRYDSYLVVDFYAETSASMHVWGKFVQSRLRKLVDSLHHVSSVSRVHAFPLYFPNTSEGRTPGSCMFIGVEFHSRSRTNTDAHGQAKDDPEVKSNLERTIRFFLATDLQQLAERKQDMCAEARLLNWGDLPDFVFDKGRPSAMVERAEYHEDMERMTMMQSHNTRYHSGGGERYPSGKWRSPNGGQRVGGGRYFGPKPNGGGKQYRGNGGDRYRDATQKPYFMAQGG